MFKNKTLLIIALIAVVNALGYGIIIPVLYSYSRKYGLSDFQNGLLFALYSLCQFLSAPLIGRLSDKYGRKPLLTLSIFGTALSFLLMAFAPSAIFLFLARALDGLTAGNLPVASAVISDTTEPKDRAKGFGMIGAAFGFGFIFGPAISAVTVTTSPAMPFIVAAVITVVATILTVLFLPETNKNIGVVHKAKLFDFNHLYHALFDENVGMTLIISLCYAITFSMYVYAFQPYAVKVLHFSANQISLFFTAIGIIGVITQVVLIGKFTKIFGLKKGLSTSLLLIAIVFFAIFSFHQTLVFIVFGMLFALGNSFVSPLIQTILSRETDEKSQGSMQGLNASYMSIGQIIGPIVGGILATMMITFPFLSAGILALICFFLSFHILQKGVKKENTFDQPAVEVV